MIGCGTVYMLVQAEELVEFRCVEEQWDYTALHIHEWEEVTRLPRCPKVMNGYRCEIWKHHSGDCHNKELMYALAGETPPPPREGLPVAAPSD